MLLLLTWIQGAGHGQRTGTRIGTGRERRDLRDLDLVLHSSRGSGVDAARRRVAHVGIHSGSRRMTSSASADSAVAVVVVVGRRVCSGRPGRR